MQKYTRAYIIQMILTLTFGAMSVAGISKYDPTNTMLYYLVGGVVGVISLAFTVNYFLMRKKNRD